MIPVVDNGGEHGPGVRSGSVWLNRELHPFRLEWFNGHGPFALRLEYEGPGFGRRKVPATAFWREQTVPKGGSSNSFNGLEQGLNFSAYVADLWRALPEFR